MALEYFFHYIFILRVLRRIVVPVYFRCIATSNALHAKKNYITILLKLSGSKFPEIIYLCFVNRLSCWPKSVECNFLMYFLWFFLIKKKKKKKKKPITITITITETETKTKTKTKSKKQKYNMYLNRSSDLRHYSLPFSLVESHSFFFSYMWDALAK